MIFCSGMKLSFFMDTQHANHAEHQEDKKCGGSIMFTNLPLAQTCTIIDTNSIGINIIDANR